MRASARRSVLENPTPLHSESVVYALPVLLYPRRLCPMPRSSPPQSNQSTHAIPQSNPSPRLVRSVCLRSAHLYLCARRAQVVVFLSHMFGTLVEELGSIEDIEVGTSVLLEDRGSPTEEFSKNGLKSPTPIPWA